MGHFAENTAQRYQFTREQQDEFAIRSLTRAKKANEDGTFDREMVPMTMKGRKGEKTVRSEEHTSELQSLMRISYAVFCLKHKNSHKRNPIERQHTQAPHGQK